MHRDIKLGLLLGVAMVLIVAVFFFGRSNSDREQIKKLVPESPKLVKALEKWQSRHQRRGHTERPAPATTPTPQAEQAHTGRARPPQPNAAPERQGRDAETPQPSVGQTAGASGQPAVTHSPKATVPGPASAQVLVKPSPRSQRRLHTVAHGDTLFKIAEKYYHDGYQFPAIWEANRERIPNPDRLRPRTVLLIPDPDRARLTQTRYYVVRPSDTLVGIARKLYLDSRKYLAIYRANSHILTSPNDLRVGMMLVLPSRPTATVASSPRQRH